LELIRGAVHAEVPELLALAHGGNPLHRGVVHATLLPLCVEPLARFLDRLYLEPPGSLKDAAVRLIVQALGSFYRIPLGTIDFHCRLYRHVLQSLPSGDDAPPQELPPITPEWLSELDATERRLLETCLAELSWDERVAVYLCFDARLTVRQIRCVLRAETPTASDEQIVRTLESSWERILRRMGVASSG
jgi:hypothetical protein